MRRRPASLVYHAAMEVDADTLTTLLERWPVACLATVTPDQRPHQVPIVFVADGGCVYTPVDGKRKSSTVLARLQNLAAHGHASLLLDAYGTDWSALWWVRLEGPARVLRGDAALLERVAGRLRAKYPQYRTVPAYAGRPTLIELRWQRVAAWSQVGDCTPIRRALAALIPGGP